MACKLSFIQKIILFHWRSGRRINHAAVFPLLFNNCFLVVSEAPASYVLSMPEKALSLQLGEKIFGGGALQKWSSESHTIEPKRMGRHLHMSGLQDEGKQPDSNTGESQGEL